MKRLETGEGSSPLIWIRVHQKTADMLSELVERFPPHPVVGPHPRPTVLREVVEAGIEALAKREGIKLGTAAVEPPKGRRASKPAGGKSVHPNSRQRAEERAAARLAAGCKCGPHNHVRTCKLYRRSAAA